jgi:uncharacterized repeat protein (TIGR01451 family)
MELEMVVRRRVGAMVARGCCALVLGAAAFTTLVLQTAPASAATGANFVATGHDMDFHCSGGDTNECAYLKIVVDKVRNGSTLPILALDQGTELPDALTAAGEAPVTVVDPSNATAFNAVAFTSGGAPKFSAIITASDSTCGGCDNTPAGEANINARANDFKDFFNAGGGILALAGADNRGDYYKFVPLGLTAAAVSPPFTVQPAGAALGITDAMVNCCATHNSFVIPAPPLGVLETDSMGLAETIFAFGASIGGGGFTSVTATKTADAAATVPGAQDGYTITLANTGSAAAPVTTITDTLPAGFSYVAGSTTGGITANPTVSGSQLTWTGTFSVPASGTLVFHFKVTVSTTPGHYTNSASASNGASTVASVTGTAPIDVGTVAVIPTFPLEGLPVAIGLGGGLLYLFYRFERRRRPVTG